MGRGRTVDPGRGSLIIQISTEGNGEMESRLSQLVTTLTVISLLGLATQSAVASESQSRRLSPRDYSIHELSQKLETYYAVSPDHPEVDPKYVERRVREYFADIPVMIGICGCESTFQQYREDGTLLVSRHVKEGTNRRDSTALGVCQITYKNHYGNWTKSPETDITTLEGNLAYARWLYEENGTSDWSQCGG